jgi:hypothetical protein
MNRKGLNGRLIRVYPGRCDLRVFETFLHDGNPPGRVLLIGVAEETSDDWRLLASISLTGLKNNKGSGFFKGRRLIIFPPWDPLEQITWNNGQSGDESIFNAHHISFDADANGRLCYHAKGVDREEKSEIEGACSALTDGYLLGALLIPSMAVLKRFGSFAGMATWPSSEKRFRECLDIVGKSTRTWYPVFHIPKLRGNPQADSLACVFFLTNSKASSTSYDLVVSTTMFDSVQKTPVTERDLCWTTSIKIDDGIYINIMFRRLLRTPIGKFRWVPAKAMRADGDRIILGPSFHGVQ